MHAEYDVLSPWAEADPLLACPSHAATLAEAGWTKAAVIEHLERSNPEFPANTALTSIGGPESVQVVVAGGPGAWIGLVLGVGRWVSKPIVLPAAWGSLVKKYRDYMPNYLRY